MDTLKVLTDALERSQVELAEAEIQLMEASARAGKARDATARLEAAVAALSGEPPPAAEERQKSQAVTPSPTENTPSDIQKMTPEEFDAHRRRQQRAKEREIQKNNPLAHIACSGCGVKGSLSQQIVAAPSGVPVRMMVCSGCGNQTIS